ncbi:hypothetical protein [Streptomyces sp. NPDC127098]|uniref:hypothetical protein n=1 Tax=Streptomyces sp. NPDC127098 TaxID=3347137 RepID=UPI00364DE70A
MAKPHVISVRFEGGPRHGRTVDLVITGQALLPLMLAARQEGAEATSSGLYELRTTQGGGTRYTWIEDLPVRA